MPVEASDIVQGAMDSGAATSTGCEQAGLRSDERVRKMTEGTSEASLSNQIHIEKPGRERKAWKSAHKV
jgi:hypothetical protein